MGRPKKEQTVESVKTRRTYKPKTPLNEHQAKKQRCASKRQDMLDQQAAREMVSDLYKQHLPEVLEKRQKEFDEALQIFKVDNEIKIQEKSGRIDASQLRNLLGKPLITMNVTTKFSAEDIVACSDCYWECVDKANEDILFIPTIMQFCRLMGMSTSTIVSYYYSSDKLLAEAAQMVKDRFIDFYTIKGLTNEINSIMAIFAMKSQYGLRDNDPPQIVVNNQTRTVPEDEIARLEAQYSSVIDVDFDEV